MKLSKFNETNFLQLINIDFIFWTLEVSKVDKSSSVKELQLPNINVILITEFVTKFVKTNLSKAWHS